MGFSVSGATGIVLVGAMIAFGTAFAAGANGFELVSDAQEERADMLLDQQNTDVGIADATYEGNDGPLYVEVDNEGSTVLSVEDTSLLVDGEFVTESDDGIDGVSTDVDGDEATDVWATGQTLNYTVKGIEEPTHAVKVVTETGVADVWTDWGGS